MITVAHFNLQLQKKLQKEEERLYALQAEVLSTICEPPLIIHCSASKTNADSNGKREAKEKG